MNTALWDSLFPPSFCFDYPRYEYDLGPHSGHERWLSKNTMDDGRRTTGCGFGRGLRSGRHCGGHAALSDIFTLFKIVGQAIWCI